MGKLTLLIYGCCCFKRENVQMDFWMWWVEWQPPKDMSRSQNVILLGIKDLQV
jgi:hypothetical protein